jgi:hypothetical protein
LSQLCCRCVITSVTSQESLRTTGMGKQNGKKMLLQIWFSYTVLGTIITVDFTKLWPRQLRGWLGIWEL